jgi:hypothetical protein
MKKMRMGRALRNARRKGKRRKWSWLIESGIRELT